MFLILDKVIMRHPDPFLKVFSEKQFSTAEFSKLLHETYNGILFKCVSVRLNFE